MYYGRSRTSRIRSARIARISKEDKARYEAQEKAERDRRAALTPEQRAAEDAARESRLQAVMAEIERERMSNSVRKHFDSIGDFFAWGAKRPTRPHNAKEWDRMGSNRGAGWLGVDSVAAVQALVRDGWPEGVQRTMDALKDIEGPLHPIDVRRRRVWTDQGDSLDIHRVYSGSLDTAWQRTKRRTVRATRNVRLICNVNANAGINAVTQMFWRGAAALKIADELTKAGYNVEIVAALASTSMAMVRPLNCTVTVVVKEYASPLDLNTLATALCLGGFARLFGFRSDVNVCEEKGLDIANGWGHSSTYSTLNKLEQHEIEVQESVFNVWSARDVVSKVLKDFCEQEAA